MLTYPLAVILFPCLFGPLERDDETNASGGGGLTSITECVTNLSHLRYLLCLGMGKLNEAVCQLKVDVTSMMASHTQI